MYEIELIDSGDIFELNEQSIIKVTYSSFNLSKIDRNNTDKSNSFEIPLTPKNIKILKGLGTPSNVSNKPHIYNGVNLRYKGDIIIERGTIVFQEINFNKDTIKANIIDRDASFYALIRDLKLRDAIKEFDVEFDMFENIQEYLTTDNDIFRLGIASYCDNSITQYPLRRFDPILIYDGGVERRGYKGLDDYNVSVLDLFKPVRYVEPTFDYDLTNIKPLIFTKWLVSKSVESLGYTIHYPDAILEDLDELVIPMTNNPTSIEIDEDGEVVYENKTFMLSEYLPDLKVGDILKELVVRFNLNIVIDEDTKDIQLKLWDDVLTDFDNAIDFSKYVSVKNKEVYSNKDFGILNRLSLDSDDEVNEIIEKGDGTYSTDLLELYVPNKPANLYRGTLIVNNSNTEMEKEIYKSSFKAPTFSNYTIAPTAFKRRLDAAENKLWMVFGRIMFGDLIDRPLINLTNDKSSYDNNKVDSAMMLRLKRLPHRHNYRITQTYDNDFWELIRKENPLRGESSSNPRIRYNYVGDGRSYHSGHRNYDPILSYNVKNKYIALMAKNLLANNYLGAKGQDGRGYLGDYAFNMSEIRDFYNSNDAKPTLYQTMEFNDREYIYLPAEDIQTTVKPKDGVFAWGFVSYIDNRYPATYKPIYLGVNYTISKEDDDDMKKISFSPSIEDSSYNYWQTLPDTKVETLNHADLVTDEDLNYDYFLKKYHPYTRGLYSNYNEQEWQCILPPSLVDDFKFDRLIYLDQEQAYFYVNEIKEYDATTGIATLNIMKVDYVNKDREIKYFKEKSNNVVRILFLGNNLNEDTVEVFQNIFDDTNVDYIKDGAILLDESNNQYKFEVINNKTYLKQL